MIMFEFNGFQTLGQILAALGTVLIVFNVIISVTGSRSRLRFAGAKINGSKSTVIFLIGIGFLAYHVYSTQPNDKPVPLSGTPLQTERPVSGTSSQAQNTSASSVTDHDVAQANANKNDTPSGGKTTITGWSYYGHLTSDGAWKEKNFTDGSGLDLKPQAGDLLHATGNVSFREGPAQYSILSGWTNQPRIDILKIGSPAKVIKTLVIQRSYYWIQTEMK